MKDYFISYSKADRKFALWIAEVLESSNFTVTIQDWDFKPGNNFVTQINNALLECNQLIVILSSNYLKSKWCESEWTSKLTEAIRINDAKIIPIRIEPIEVKGLLAPIVYIDIVNRSEDDAKLTIINGLKSNCERKSEGFPSYFNLEHIEIDNYYYVNKAKIEFIKTCKSKILNTGRNKIHHRITWFIDEEVKLLSLTDGVEIELLELKDTNLNYNVVFDHTLKEGELVEYKIKAILTNNKNHFKDFFSTEIITPVKVLNIHLNLSNDNVKKIYTQKISSSPLNVRTEQANEHEFCSPFRWQIQKPELYFEYKIYW